MTSEENTASARTGRPLDAQVDERIIRAARQLLETGGFPAVTISEVARLAGLPRSTVYRRYPTVTSLRYSARYIPSHGLDPVADTGDITADMRTHVAANAAGFTGEGKRSLRTLLCDILADDDARADLTKRFLQPRLDKVSERIERAREQQQLPARIDPDLAAQAVTGILIYHSLVLDLSVDDELVHAIVDLLFPVENEFEPAS